MKYKECEVILSYRGHTSTTVVSAEFVKEATLHAVMVPESYPYGGKVCQISGFEILEKITYPAFVEMAREMIKHKEGTRYMTIEMMQHLARAARYVQDKQNNNHKLDFTKEVIVVEITDEKTGMGVNMFVTNKINPK